jgi:DNA-binding MarR family transcriptional regulator
MSRTKSELASQLRVAVARLGRRLRQEGSGEDATPSQLTVLSTLYRHGPMTLGELAATERVKPPSMTRIVAALEERGLVSREHSTEDARVVSVAATKEGRRAHEEYQKRRDAWLCRKLEHMTAEEREVLTRASELMERLIQP